ncbi:MAG: DegQ family serine endoprotease [Chloroflexota bacterium]
MERERKIGKIFITLLVVAVLVGLGYGASTAVKTSQHAVNSTSAASDAPMVPGNFSELAARVRSSVVNVQTTKMVKGVTQEYHDRFGGRFDDFFGRFFDENPFEGHRQQGVGSGFVISADGLILTNNHVVDQADKIKVKLADGKELDAKVVGRDPKTDLAVIKVAGATDLRPLTLGNSDDLKVGNWVVAVGNPFGLDQTVTAGIVSGKGRVIGSGPYDNFIQTDASINPGNSGGPLINTRGEVVGINTAIIASGQGIGFAIPINMAKEIIPQLEEKGHVTRGWLGLSIQEVTPQLAKSFGLKEKRGALVAEVIEGSPAQKAGIARGDVILEFDGKEVTESRDLPRIVASTPVGKSVTVKYLRDGKPDSLKVTVAQMQSKEEIAAVSPHKPLGMTVQNITPETAQALGLRSSAGVVVAGVEPGSPAAEAGIQRGDVIVEANRKSVRDVDDLQREIAKAREDNKTGGVLLFIQRGQSSLYAAVTPE